MVGSSTSRSTSPSTSRSTPGSTCGSTGDSTSYSTSNSTIKSTMSTRDTALRSVTFTLTSFNLVTELRETDMSKPLYSIDLQSDLQPILHPNLHLDLHTDLLADLQTNLHVILQGNLQADLQAVQHWLWWVQDNPYYFLFTDPVPHLGYPFTSEPWLILLEWIRDQFLTGQMTMTWCNISENGRKRWKFSSEVLSLMPMMQSNATTSFTGQGKQAWSWWTSGKLKRRSQMTITNWQIFQIVWVAHLSKI